MELESIRVLADVGDESLTLALLALLRANDCAIEYDEVNSALGISFLAVAADAPLEYWSVGGRNVKLEQSARLFGIYLRALHPLSAARGLETAEEFAGHFRDSYLPLIDRSIAGGEPVLAWQGWPGSAAMHWGIITRLSDGPMGVAGTAPGFGGVVDLTAPAVQCYAVEAVTGASPSATDVVGQSMLAAADLLSNTSRIGPWTTGPVTFDTWRERLLEGQLGDPLEAHARLARSIAANRKCAGRFVSRHQSVITSGARQVELVIRHSRMAGELAAELAPHLGGGPLSEEMLKKCAEKIRQIQSEDEAIADNVSAIANRLAPAPI